ncbi:MAG: family 43 glycosylhydrolase [Bacteroidales bacterium]|nr:family 43 glycosylhydrolase [Bacteroidales bacterium]
MRIERIHPVVWALALLACACTPAEPHGARGPVEKPDPSGGETPATDDGLAPYTLCDFDAATPVVKPVNSTFEVVDNPAPDAVNGSSKVGKSVLNGGTWDCVMVEPTHPLVFVKDPAVIKVKVLAPAAGLKVYLQLKVEGAVAGAPDKQMVSLTTTTAGKWEEMVFDFRSLGLPSNWYDQIYLLFNGGTKAAGEVWYFDDVRIPDDDLSSLSLFKKWGADPLMDADKSHAWMSNSIANPCLLSPSESPDGNWWLFTRGGDGTRGSLGIFTQGAKFFNPLGPWTYYAGNPVVPYGYHGVEDGRLAIDPCPVVGKDGTLYLFYKGTSVSGANTVLLATSKDGFTYTKVDKPWKEDCGVADVVRWDDTYYLFVSRRVYRFTDPLSGDNAEMFETLSKGDGPSHCDRYSINGQKVMRMDGRWFIFYQASACNADFPDRIHVAVSDDLVNWTKVANEQPLFTRGARGTWDQGAIWAPDTFEYNGTLYMYYEGWGRTGTVENRDKSYFTPAHSAIGLATCKKEDFLKWCGITN